MKDRTHNPRPDAPPAARRIIRRIEVTVEREVLAAIQQPGRGSAGAENAACPWCGQFLPATNAPTIEAPSINVENPSAALPEPPKENL